MPDDPGEPPPGREQSLRQRLEVCDARVREHLDPDERVLAIGRAEDITERGGPEQGGATWTYVMVTNRRLRWVPHADLRFEAALDLDDVIAVTEEAQAHRYALTLDHRPIHRLHRVPARRFLRFEWGNAYTLDPLTRTRLAFSRQHTAAAVALRAELASRGVL